MRKKMLSLLALAGGALTWAGCHRDTPAPAPDPCLGVAANPLSFRFLEGFGTPTPDTAYSHQNITFEGPGKPYTSYEWQIGTDARAFTQQKVTLYFQDGEAGSYPVRLIARRPPNTACFPKDDGVDTLTKVLTLMPTTTKSPLLGKYLGANTDAPSDTFTIRIYKAPYYVYPNDPAYPPYTYLRNLSKGCTSPYFVVGQTWRGIDFDYGGDDFSCHTEVGTGYLTTNDSIRISYERNEVYPERKKHVFLGKRVR